MNTTTESIATMARETAAQVLSICWPIAVLYTLYLMVPFVRGGDGYVGLQVVQAITNEVVHLTELYAGIGFSAVSRTNPAPNGLAHTVLYYFDGLAICLAVAALVGLVGAVACRLLLVGPRSLVRDIRSMGFVNAVARSATK